MMSESTATMSAKQYRGAKRAGAPVALLLIPVLRDRVPPSLHKDLKQGNGALPERDGLGSPEQNSSRHIKAEWSERINRRHCRLEPDSETFSNFFRTALRLPGRDAAVCDMLSAASVAAEYRDWPGALAVREGSSDTRSGESYSGQLQAGHPDIRAGG